jgi:hypothetical protein
VALKLYQHSLSITFLSFFALCFVAHAVGGAQEYSEEQQAHNQPPVSVIKYMGTSRFWFESFQTWQSGFLSIGAIVVLSVFLRERGSPESKPVATPHGEGSSG